MMSQNMKEDSPKSKKHNSNTATLFTGTFKD